MPLKMPPRPVTLASCTWSVAYGYVCMDLYIGSTQVNEKNRDLASRSPGFSLSSRKGFLGNALTLLRVRFSSCKTEVLRLTSQNCHKG